MKVRVAAALLMVGVALVLGVPRGADAKPKTPPTDAPVTFDYAGFVRVIDGDTVEIWRDSKTWGIGYIGIDADEGNTPCGQAASGRQWELTSGGVRFEAEAPHVLDQQGRRLYHPVTLDGVSIEETLVREGLARASNRPSAMHSVLQAAERDARQAGRGCVWGANPGTPTKRRTPPATTPQIAGAPAGALNLSSIGTITGTAPPAPGGAQTLGVTPSGFDDLVVANGFTEPTTFEFVPDGRIFVAEKHGIVRVVKNGAVLPDPLIDISAQVNDYWDRGLIGMTLDPNFATNGYLYFLYVRENNPSAYSGPKTSQLARVTVVGDSASPATLTVILGTATASSCSNLPAGADCIPADSPSHSAGNVRFGSDGKLYLTSGDASAFNFVDSQALRAQDVNSLAGKFIRINVDGTGVSDNPFWDGNPNSIRSKVWASGLRNAFRFNMNPANGVMYIGDVGWDSVEEIDVARRGANFGWPCYEGTGRQSGYSALSGCQTLYAQGASAVRAPLYEWTHCCGGSASVGGAFTTSYPAPYQNAYFFGDYGQSWIRYLRTDANDNLIGSVTDFLTQGNGPVSIQRGSEGDIYYLAINTGEVRRIRGTSNRQPVPQAAATPTNGLAPLDVSFSSTGSLDPDGDPMTFSWNFGDNTPAVAGASASHRYTANGVYTAILTATDNRGAQGTASVVITVGNRAPTITITSPGNGSLYAVGDHITLSGYGSDLDDGGSFPSSSLSWQVILHHAGHNHFFLTATGSSAAFDIPDHGDNTYFEIILDGVDSGGLHGKTAVFIYPQPVTVTLNSNPSSMILVWDGVPQIAPATITSIAKSSHTLTATTPQGTANFQYWSDGGAAQHNITLGTANVSLTAVFTGVIDFDDLNNFNTPLNGVYPTNQVDWGTNVWFLSSPWGGFLTNSISFNGPGMTSGSFRFLTPRRITSLQAFTMNNGSSTVTLACGTNTTKSQVISPNVVTTITTGWTSACTTVTVTSSNGWDTNFDTIAHDAGASLDQTPPVFTNVQPTGITSNGATINWTTDEASTTQVEYGPNANYGSFAPASPNPSLVTSHAQALTGLTPSTTYYYRVRSTDGAGNAGVSGQFTFQTTADTTAPVITNVQPTAITSSGATITWTTDEGSTTQVEYGTNTNYGSFAPSSPNPSLVTAHSQPLSGLAPSTTYYYRVRSTDAYNNQAVSGGFTFQTATPPDQTPPVFTNVQPTTVTSSGATITWTTDEASTTQVEYGLNANYGSFAPASPNPSLVTSHSQALTGLTPSTTYYYRVRSTDAAGNAGVSGQFTFQTTADTTAPVITNVQPTAITSSGATITWTTDEGSTTQVEYGTNTNYGSFAPATPNPSLVTAHSQPLSGLAAATTYYYRVRSTDAYNNQAISGPFTFQTSPLVGNALRFDGVNDTATVSDSNSLDLVGPLTIEAWIKLDNLRPGQWQAIVLKQGSTRNLAYALYYRDGLWFEIVSGGLNVIVQDRLPLQTGVWYHVAGVYDRSTLRTYVNGQQTASLAFTGAAVASTFALTIGNDTVWSGEQFAGTIDEVRLSSNARYTAAFTPPGRLTSDANTAALWHLDENTGQTSVDASPNANTLRLGSTTSVETSDPTWVTGSSFTPGGAAGVPAGASSFTLSPLLALDATTAQSGRREGTGLGG